MVKDGMTELEKVRAQAKAYVQSFAVDVVIVNQDGALSMHHVGLAPEGAAEIEMITRFYNA